MGGPSRTGRHRDGNVNYACFPSPRPAELPAELPGGLPAQVAAIRKLLPTIGQDPESLAACFGRKNKKRTDQITGILATLKALGHI